MKRVWKITAALIGVALVVFLVLLGLGVYTLYEYMHPVGRTTSLEPVEFIIEGHRFRIPMAYIWEWEKWGGGEVVSINLKASLPDLKPYSEETKHQYDDDVPGLGQLVSIGIWRIHDEGIGPRPQYFAPGFLKRCADGPYGFRRCPHDTYDEREVFVKQEGLRNIAFDCDKKGIIEGEGCMANLPFVDGIKLHFAMDRKKLDQSDEIIKAVYRLVCGFYLKGAGRAVTYNYCTNGVYHGR